MRPRYTLRWLMMRVALAAVYCAILATGIRQSARYGCGNPFAEAILIVLCLIVGPPLVRAMARAYR